ncbi:MAG: isopenicillin N synthase family oxygenase, partial [Alphaproteobacteria bacterium]|nr:isopenicillin N synthase family oxygenase [Alphaproteobacteria bacterium]
MSNIAVARTIDLAKFDQGDLAAKREVAAEFDRAGRENGFMILKGHGVDLALLDRCFAEA